MLTIQINQEIRRIDAFPPELTLLEYLRGHLGLTGTKEGCASGDCGACTVMVGHPGKDVHTVNACITPLGSMQGQSVFTVEAMQGKDGELHPVQAAMIKEHGAQCGFCTPGFVVSLVGHSLASGATDRESIVTAIGGNLCRCTGYKPIIAAGMSSCAATDANWFSSDDVDNEAELEDAKTQPSLGHSSAIVYERPQNLEALAACYLANPSARLVAGATDLWLEVTQQLATLPQVIDLGGVTELAEITTDGKDLVIGAGVTHSALEKHFAPLQCEAIAELLARFGSPQVRNRGTIGGNLGNASPIADWPPLLLCLDAELVLQHGTNTRTLPLLSFYKGYRETALAPGELISHIRIPGPVDWQSIKFHKISKRIEDDISSVAGAFRFTTTDGVIETARIAYGGMAATPLRLTSLEPQLVGQQLSQIDFAALDEWFDANLSPISDVRASATYRLAMAKNMLHQSIRDALS